MSTQQIQPISRSALVQWGIYHRCREFAREIGDPCLGIVRARTKSQAETVAWRKGIIGPTGLWAHPLQDEKPRPR